MGKTQSQEKLPSIVDTKQESKGSEGQNSIIHERSSKILVQPKAAEGPSHCLNQIALSMTDKKICSGLPLNSLSAYCEAKRIVEQKILQQSDERDLRVVTRLYEKTMDSKWEIDIAYDLMINNNRQSSRKLLKSLKSLTIDTIKVINASPKNKRILKNFLQNSFPRRVKDFTLLNQNKDSLLNEKYLRGVSNISHQITTNVTFTNFKISQSSLMRILSACRDKEEILFYSCHISVEKVPEFGHSLDGSTIKTMNFCNSQIVAFFKQEMDFCSLLNLIKGLSKSEDFRKSLSRILFSENIDKDKLEKILQELGFSKTYVIVY
ncbi:unnamed protein product [Moneuplotes crassus]|uniref:Uncharacterized protein n=1 Tax=Euplotes crassus TaxID=5936 RepID=A0AAD1XNN3_EUPCR|nr:unnamed protein product [Moneuplotes crassus]